ncbi:MAG TPA: formate dehydrogenase accessory sulfurtransferase FdhD [Methanocella sp.]|jgi:FdhD protein
MKSDITGAITASGPPEELTASFDVVALDRDRTVRTGAEVCVEESVNLLLNGTRMASLTMTPADLEAFAYGYLVCEGIARSMKDINRVEVRWPDIVATMQSVRDGDASLWMEIRSSGCVGVRSSWSDLTEPVQSGLSVDLPTIFTCMSLINDLASLWSRTGGAHCSVICDRFGGLVSYAEDVGRHTSIDKAVGKALLDGRDLSECFLISTGRMPAGMVAKAYRAGLPIVISNTAPLTSGVEIARRLGMTLVCFARPPRMSIYSGKERIRGITPGGN